MRHLRQWEKAGKGGKAREMTERVERREKEVSFPTKDVQSQQQNANAHANMLAKLTMHAALTRLLSAGDWSSFFLNSFSIGPQLPAKGAS